MKFATVLLCGSSLLIGCGDSAGPIQLPPDNHEQMVLETIPYSAIGSTTLTFSREELIENQIDKRGVIELDGGAATGSITFSVWGPWVVASPTSRTLAYQGSNVNARGDDRSYDIYIRDWQAETGTPIGGPGGIRNTPSWSPDGNRVLFTEADESFDLYFTRIVTQSATAGPSSRQVLWQASRSCEFAYGQSQNAAGTVAFTYSPFTSPCTYTPNIARATPGGEAEIIYVSPAAAVFSPAWSPSGTEIAFLEADGFYGSVSVAIRLMDADGANVRTIASVTSRRGTSEYEYSLCWAQDGSRVFFSYSDVEAESHIFSATLPDGTVTQITSAPGVRDSSVSCSA
jgi:Tol biopolymer transport system component